MHGAREGSRRLRRARNLIAGLCGLVAILGAGIAAPAHAGTPPYAAMAIDANTGAVLHNRAGDAPRYPASLTKMMTLYMAFELIELGRHSYSSKIKMTEEGAAAAPSKLGLKPGEEIALIDAIKALVTKSANDVAIALAQHIGGTEANFARLMTAKARAIGMSNTTFRNASGLPDEAQVTTARDMLTLALRLQDDFPRHYKVFATQSFTYAGKTYRNHNALIARYRGTDGIKTGYTRASGFNLVSSVRRDGKHVVAAVIGGKTAGIRNTRMRALLDAALDKASTKVTRKPSVRVPPPVAVKPPAPRTNPSLETAALAAAEGDRAKLAPAGAEPAPAIAVAKVRRVLIGPELRREPPAEGTPAFAAAGMGGAALPQFVPASGAFQPALAPSTLDAQAAALERAAPQVPAVAQDRPRQAAATPAGPFAIQIGAYNDSADAERHMDAARQRAAGLLDPYAAVAVPFRKGSSQLYRARFRGFEAAAATNTCLQLRRLQIDCFVVSTE
jgi:D-alanyl-D-alanine carboxypeptidase